MNIYKVRFQSEDHRLWEVIVKADGISLGNDIVFFWKGIFRRKVHAVSKKAFIAALCEKEGAETP